MKIKRKRDRRIIKNYELRFKHKSTYGWGGYGFPCNSKGVLLNKEHKERIRELKLDPEYENQGLYSWDQVVVDPAIGECEHCGKDVTLWDSMNNECECGANYNVFGGRIKPISQQFNEYGLTDDTGETWSDVYGPYRDEW